MKSENIKANNRILTIEDAKNILACTCVRFYDGSPHHKNCPIARLEKSKKTTRSS